MSALAGILKFDPLERVHRKELLDLARGIDRIGPDGGSEHIDRRVGMAYRAFHTTPESHFEAQPLVRPGYILTWDGRLDNREEIRSRVNLQCDSPPTDVELVAAAFETWGTGCLAELIGDWALAIWEQANESLILARDAMGVRRLFYRLDEDGVSWCTSIEPLVLTAPARLHLDLDYLAGCLYPRPPIEKTSYQEIRAVVPASFLEFRRGGEQRTERYWSLNPHASIRYASDAEYEEHFRSIFRDSVRRRLRSERPVLAELSGGVDSSSIVCMADDVRREEPGPPIETLSYFDIDEPSGDERPYFNLIEQRRGRTGHHISLSDFNRQFGSEAWMPLPDRCFSASPGYSARSLRWDATLVGIQSECRARILLSGTGGDEVLGGVQYEAPELADHLLAGRLIPLCRSAFGWSLARNKTVYKLLGEALELILARYRPESQLANPEPRLSWTHLKPPKDHRALRMFTMWRDLPPALLSVELTRYALAQQLTCTDPPIVGCYEKRYPFLDRSLFTFLASVPRTQLLQPGRRRHLMRRALNGLVPDEVLYRKTKWFGMRGPAAALAPDQIDLDRLFRDRWHTDGAFFSSVILRKQILLVQHGSSREAMAIRSAIGIEDWIRAQLRHGTIQLESPTRNRAAALERAPPIT